MSASKTFECQVCESSGKIVVRTDDVNIEDIQYCPVCGSPIYEESDDD